MFRVILTVASFIATMVILAPAYAGGDLSKREPITIRVDLGEEASNKPRFHPAMLGLKTGELYRLVLHNPSGNRHSFTSDGLFSRVWTHKVQVMDDVGPSRKSIAEIKGVVREIEILPGGTTEWWFVPIATGVVTDLKSYTTDQDGAVRREKGMAGKIVIW